jgi:hypothetical protein
MYVCVRVHKEIHFSERVACVQQSHLLAHTAVVCMYTYIHTYMHTHVWVCVCVCTTKFISANVSHVPSSATCWSTAVVCMFTYISLHMHIYIHAHVRVCTHTQNNKVIPWGLCRAWPFRARIFRATPRWHCPDLVQVYIYLQCSCDLCMYAYILAYVKTFVCLYVCVYVCVCV